MLRLLHALGNGTGLRPVARAFVNGQQCQAGFGFVGRALQAAQRFFGGANRKEKMPAELKEMEQEGGDNE